MNPFNLTKLLVFSVRQQVLNIRSQVAGLRQQVGSLRYLVPVVGGELVNVSWEEDSIRQQVPAEGWALENKGQHVAGVRPITLSVS